MSDKILPSGKILKDPFAPKSEVMESTSGAMSLDVDGQCPKCKDMMSQATACGETVYYCENCRVSLPLPITE